MISMVRISVQRMGVNISITTADLLEVVNVSVHVIG